MTRHLITVADLTSAEIERIFSITEDLKTKLKEGLREPLLPGRTLRRGILPGDENFLFLPDDFPFAPDPEDGLPVGGIETYKLFVTARPADFGWLEQSWMRAASIGAQLPLRRLFDLAYAGIGERGPHPVPLDAEEAWTTVERSFRLQRPAGVAEGGGP